jgi:hypothetical protein
MTASVVRGRAPERARPARWAAHRSREALVFSVATAIALLHALDDASSIVSLASASASTRLAVGLSVVLGLGAVYAFTCEGAKDEHTQ